MVHLHLAIRYAAGLPVQCSDKRHRMALSYLKIRSVKCERSSSIYRSQWSVHVLPLDYQASPCPQG